MSSLRHLTLKEHVYHRLLNSIISGDIPLGSQIDERKVAEMLSISRTPLREAIGTLVEEGLVEYRPYRGNFVRRFTAKQVNDLYEVRKALEGLAVRLAVTNLSDADLSGLVSTLEDVKIALEQNDLDEFSAADRRFHESIAQLSRNETLVESLNRLGLHIQVIRNIANRDPDVVERTSHERPRILEALKARDAELAAHLMAEHIEGIRRSVVAQVETYERSGTNRWREDTQLLVAERR